MVKDFFREIIKSKNRFLSILIIVALGVAFFSGIRAASPDMKLSADTYYDQSSLMDIRVMSTLGLTEDDADALKQVEGVEKVNVSYSADVLCSLEDSQPVLTLMSLTEDMNQVTVQEGRLPQEDDELFLDVEFLREHGFEIGDTITLAAGDGEDLEDTLKHSQYTIVGAGTSPFYLSLDRGSSTVGDGTVSGFALLPPESFTLEAYTEIYLAVDGAKLENCYDEGYEDLVDEIQDRIEDIQDERCQIRYNGLMEDGQEAIREGEQELADARTELADARQELEDGGQEIQDGWAEITDREQELSDGKEEIAGRLGDLEDGKQELSRQEKTLQESRQELESRASQLAAGRQELESRSAALESGKQQLAEGRQQLQAQRDTLEQGKAALAAAKEELEAGAGEIEAGWQELAAKEEELTQGEQQLAEGKAQLLEQKKLLESQTAAIEEARKQAEILEEQKAALQTAMDEAQKQQETVSSQKQEQQILLDQELTLPEEERDPARIRELQEIIAGLEQSLQEISANIEALQGQMEQAESALQEIRSVIDAYDRGMAAVAAGEQELAAREQQLAEGREQLEAAKLRLQEASDQLEAGRTEIQEKENALAKGETQLAQAEAVLSEKEQELSAGEAQIASYRQQLADGEAQIASYRQQISHGEAQIADAWRQLYDGEAQLVQAQQELADGEQQIADAKDTLRDSEQELSDGWETYNREAADAEKKIADGEVDLENAKKELEDLEMPEWYVLDRNSIQTFVEYGQNADRVEAIGNVFPVIFFLVAALICLTTMTRMVEENRTQIGTLKALGYGKGRIAAKYICYAFLASFIGSAIGLVAGQKTLPVVIIQAYGILYNNLPEILAPLYAGYSISSTCLAVAVITLAAFSACGREMREVPAQLMRPEAPKNGKRIFLERISFIWNHMSFSKKSTARNLFRYKKRFFMTVLGIGGCMGLLMVGFGLKDSIMAIGEKQYGELHNYSATITLDEDSSAEDREQVMENLQSDPDVTSAMRFLETSVDAGNGDEERSSYLMVPEEEQMLEDFVTLRERAGHTQYELDDSGVIITEKLAKLLDVSEGDTIYLTEGDTKRVETTVSHVAENYFYHYIYMTPELYRELYGEEPDYSVILTVNAQEEQEFEDDFQSRYMELPGVLNLTFSSSMAERIADMLKSMDTIIYVVIIAAGLLAFVVLYNLNNINISERRRELATLKVLGFYDIEVSQYVFRENVILTVIGALVGVVFGLILHRFVILTAEIDMMMFGRNIKFLSFLYSILLTFLFSMLVNVFMHFQLKKLDMVESMKSVE